MYVLSLLQCRDTGMAAIFCHAAGVCVVEKLVELRGEFGKSWYLSNPYEQASRFIIFLSRLFNLGSQGSQVRNSFSVPKQGTATVRQFLAVLACKSK